MPVIFSYFLTCRRLMAVNSLFAKITLQNIPANRTHLKAGIRENTLTTHIPLIQGVHSHSLNSGGAYGKNGSIWQLFVLCLRALGDTVPSANFYYSLGHPWKGKGCQMDFCRHQPPTIIFEGFTWIECQKAFQNWVKIVMVA